MFILDLSVNRNSGQGSQPPALTTNKKSGEEAFHQMADSKGYNKKDLDEATRKNKGITRNRPVHIEKSRQHQNNLFDLDEGSRSDEAPIFVNLFVDGQPWTLRHVTYA